MRNNPQNKTVNEVGTSYTSYLAPKLGKIYAKSINPNISLDTMKKNIRNYIWNAAYSFEDETGRTEYTKKRRFLNTANSIDDKTKLYFLCLNSVKKAKQIIAR